jgi:mycothiol synthase
MAKVFATCRRIDGLEWSYTEEDISNEIEHLTNCDPLQDILIAEVDGQPIAWTRAFWGIEYSGDRIYRHWGLVNPEWRRMGLGTAILQFGEQRMCAVAYDHPSSEPRLLQVWAADSQVGKAELLRKHDYKPDRYIQEMSQTLDAELPSVPMPDGLEVRAVEDAHIRAIWEANTEAFQDHWGARLRTEDDYEEWKAHRNFNPTLWRVAWDGEEVAGMVLNYIDGQENKDFRRQRGYTEDIAVRRPWRRRGLARSLIALSLHSLKDLGMEEAALAVDTQNLSGAFRLYEGLGYKPFKSYTVYRKRMEY